MPKYTRNNEKDVEIVIKTIFNVIEIRSFMYNL